MKPRYVRKTYINPRFCVETPERRVYGVELKIGQCPGSSKAQGDGRHLPRYGVMPGQGEPLPCSMPDPGRLLNGIMDHHEDPAKPVETDS